MKVWAWVLVWALVLPACTSALESPSDGTESAVSSTSTAAVLTTTPATTTITSTSVVAQPNPFSGDWVRTNPDLGELYVQPRDLIWNGEFFWVMARIGFGDIRLWRSPDGVTWSELPQLGRAGLDNGPWVLTAVDEMLVAGGVTSTATVWMFDGDEWTEVLLDAGAVVGLLHYDGRFYAATAHPAMVWGSSDGLEWEPYPEPSFVSQAAVTLLEGPQGVTAIAYGAGRIEIATTTDGEDWTAVTPDGLPPSDFVAFASDPSQLVALASTGQTWRSIDTMTWTELDSIGAGLASNDGVFDSRDLIIWKLRPIAGGGYFYQPEDEPYNTVDPFVWAWLNPGWAPLEVLRSPLPKTTLVTHLVPGSDRMLALVDADWTWAIYVYALGQHVDQLVMTWVNNTGLGHVDPEVWTQRLDEACALGAWDDQVAHDLAEQYISEDGPYSLRGDDSLPDTAQAAQALWLMAVNYCRADFPVGEISDGPPPADG